MYHYLIVYEQGQWCIEFGDYDKSCVVFEQRDLIHSGQYKKKTCVVVTVPDDKPETIAAYLSVKNNGDYRPSNERLN